MNILGIDYGKQRVGLAFAAGPLARPLKSVSKAKAGRLIFRLVKELGVELVILGLPEGKLAAQVKKFSQELAAATGLPIDFQDESLTSQEALVKMIAAGKGRRKRQQEIDAFAAAQILQDWLDNSLQNSKRQASPARLSGRGRANSK